MAFLVADAALTESSKIRFNLRNTTDIEVTFRIGRASFTLKPGQAKNVRANTETSIEARPGIIGVDSGFIVGGVKKDCSLSCSFEKSENGPHTLVIHQN